MLVIYIVISEICLSTRPSKQILLLGGQKLHMFSMPSSSTRHFKIDSVFLLQLSMGIFNTVHENGEDRISIRYKVVLCTVSVIVVISFSHTISFAGFFLRSTMGFSGQFLHVPQILLCTLHSIQWTEHLFPFKYFLLEHKTLHSKFRPILKQRMTNHHSIIIPAIL